MRNLITLLLLLPICVSAQLQRSQSFDGNDTIPSNRLDIVIDQPLNSSWQIGSPDKVIFDTSFSQPNVIVTDTISPYPISDTSSFSFGLDKNGFPFVGVYAVNWVQKLDLETNADLGLLEFSIDSGNTWANAFTSNLVYNFFGFQIQNVDTLPGNVVGFSGTDSSWASIWLCFDAFFLSQQDSVRFRFKLLSDSNQTSQEGWMIDDITVRPSIVHTINEIERSEYVLLNPNPADQYVSIDLKKSPDIHYIKEVRLYDLNGREIGSWTQVPNRFKVPVGNLKNGQYLMFIETNTKSEMHQLIIAH